MIDRNESLFLNRFNIPYLWHGASIYYILLQIFRTYGTVTSNR